MCCIEIVPTRLERFHLPHFLHVEQFFHIQVESLVESISHYDSLVNEKELLHQMDSVAALELYPYTTCIWGKDSVPFVQSQSEIDFHSEPQHALKTYHQQVFSIFVICAGSEIPLRYCSVRRFSSKPRSQRNFSLSVSFASFRYRQPRWAVAIKVMLRNCCSRNTSWLEFILDFLIEVYRSFLFLNLR